MKKLITLLAITVSAMGFNKAQAQTFGVTSDTVSYLITGTTLTNIHNDITAVVDSVVLNWNVVYSDLPADWVSASGICDNFLCYNMSALWPSGTEETSKKYKTTGNHDFHMQLNQGLVTTTGCYYVTCKLVNRAAPDSVYSTFKVCKAAVGVNDVHTVAGNVKVYPSPAADNASVQFTTSQQAAVSIAVIDAMGRVVYSKPAVEMAAGMHQAEVPVAALATGIYTIGVSAGNSNVTERFRVAH